MRFEPVVLEMTIRKLASGTHSWDVAVSADVIASGVEPDITTCLRVAAAQVGGGVIDVRLAVTLQRIQVGTYSAAHLDEDAATVADWIREMLAR